MRKYLLPQSGTFYKANLHCHTNISDGKLSPEEVKKIYKDQGYSIVAYTDHDVLLSHQDLADETFLPLNGYEMEVTQTHNAPSRSKKTCHICLVALDPENLTQVCYHRSKYMIGNGEAYREQIRFDENEPDFEREYTHACVNEIMKKGQESGFFVTYNHPGWSLETYNDYIGYENMHAMEICNFGCIATGYPDYNEKEYDEMLRSGKRIYCIAADDNHNWETDSFGGFTMIKADSLDYKAIADALVAGSFYASEGPEIYDLWFEEGKIHITCSPAAKIVLNTGYRRAAICQDPEGGTVTEATFDVLPEDGYVRITVTDPQGKHANTSAYFTDTLF